MNGAVDKIMPKIALPVIIAAGIVLMFFTISSLFAINSHDHESNEEIKENNGYVRVINCIVSYPPMSREQENIENCYRTVENDLGIKLQRYDNSQR